MIALFSTVRYPTVNIIQLKTIYSVYHKHFTIFNEVPSNHTNIKISLLLTTLKQDSEVVLH